MKKEVMNYFIDYEEAKKAGLARLVTAEYDMLRRLESRDTHCTTPPVEGEDVLNGAPVSCWMLIGPKDKKSLLSVTGSVESIGEKKGSEKVKHYYEVLLNCGENKDNGVDYKYYRIHNIDGDFRRGETVFDVDFVGSLDNGKQIPVTATLKTEGSEVIRIAGEKSSMSSISKINTEDATRLAQIMSGLEGVSLANKNRSVIAARIADTQAHM